LISGSFNAKRLISVFEFCQLPAGIHQLTYAGPGRMRFGIDIQLKGIPFFSPGGSGFKSKTVGHYDIYFMVVGMYALLHKNDSP
jgi:hypothetical protein